MSTIGAALAGPFDGAWHVEQDVVAFDDPHLGCTPPTVVGRVAIAGVAMMAGTDVLSGFIDDDVLQVNGAVGSRPQRWTLSPDARGLVGTVRMEDPCAVSVQVHLVAVGVTPGPRPGADAPQVVVPPPAPPVMTTTLWQVVEPIPFRTGSAELGPGADAALDQVATLIRGRPGVRVEVAVHSDAIGADEYNLALTQARAVAVVDGLVAIGLPRELLVPTGYGESAPIAPNTTAEGRAQNRRVELRVWP